MKFGGLFNSEVRSIFSAIFSVLARAMMLTASTLDPVHGEVKGKDILDM
jgi:hypothetical protein